MATSGTGSSRHAAGSQIGRDGDLDFGRPGLVTPVHQLDETVFVNREIEPFVEALFLTDGRRDSALIVVSALHDGVVRQCK